MRRALLLVVVLLLAGCGSSARESKPPEPPRLPRALAHDWAAQADAVAAALAAGDGCTARSRATALQQQVLAAVNERRVPPRLLEPLSSGVNELVARIRCTPPPPPVVNDKGEKGPDREKRHKEHGPGKHGEGHGHGKRHR